MDNDKWNNGGHIPTGPVPNIMPYVPLNSTTGSSSSFFIMPGTASCPTMISNNVHPPFSLFNDTVIDLTNGGNKINHKKRDMKMNMGINDIYQPQHLYGPPFGNHLRNPAIIAAAKSHHPAFESIESFVQMFKTVTMMVESTSNALKMYFQAMLNVAELFTSFKPFMTKLYATIGSFKLVKWFLTKVFYLLKMVKGERGVSAEEDLWATISSTNQITPFDRYSWPLVVYFVLISTSPYFVYKLLTSATPVPTPLSTKKAKKRTLSNNASGLNECEENDEGLIGGLHDFDQHNIMFVPAENASPKIQHITSELFDKTSIVEKNE